MGSFVSSRRHVSNREYSRRGAILAGPFHDTLLAPDIGTARTDLPGGDAEQLWESIVHILQFPAEYQLFSGHGLRRSGRIVGFANTVEGQQLTILMSCYRRQAINL